MTWNECLQQRQAEFAHLHPHTPADELQNSTLISPRYNYLYANTAKVACTTIRKLLIDAEYQTIRPYAERAPTLHYNNFLPFLSVWQFPNFPQWLQENQPYTFCFVRNPYTRLLSGYLDKVVGNQAQKANILEAMGKADQPDLDISFATFIRVVCEMPVEQQDAHWRVLYYQTFQEGLEFNFIGRFENLEADLRKVAKDLGIEQYIDEHTFSKAGTTSRHHATNAGSQLQDYYTPELCALVRKGFAKDFAHFGYAEELP
ncbi:MAG: sulfotransferase family protein [Bacteroidota bacterium]